MGIFVNRTLNMKTIQAIGFDMDFTLVRYNGKAFEQATYDEVLKKLVAIKKYPKSILQLKFNFNQSLRGLVIDRPKGNIIKLNNFGRIKNSYHGTTPLGFKEQQQIYKNHYVDLNSPDYTCIDTYFSIAYASLFAQLVDLKDKFPKKFPTYEQIEKDIIQLVDISHQDDSVKGQVRNNLHKFIIQDADTVKVLERFKKYGKKLWVITNSDYTYTKLLLDYTINPFLKESKDWSDLFDLVVTGATKPRFFTDNLPFFEIHPNTGLMSNPKGPITKGIYQGGCAARLQKDNNILGDDILYLGDHIYGDILSLKKACNWRTALVIEELDQEVQALKETRPIYKKIEKLMSNKETIEQKIDTLYAREFEKKSKLTSKKELETNQKQVRLIDDELGKLIQEAQKKFNPKWGEIMRSGAEPSRFAGQVEKYACIYMSKISDFVRYSPRFYYRPKKRPLAHEMD